MTQKDTWIKKVEESLNSIERPVSDPYLYHKILTKIQSKSIASFPVRVVWASGISFVLLILLNVILFTKDQKSRPTNNNELKQLSNAFHLINENSINYN